MGFLYGYLIIGGIIALVGVSVYQTVRPEIQDSDLEQLLQSMSLFKRKATEAYIVALMALAWPVMVTLVIRAQHKA